MKHRHTPQHRSEIRISPLFRLILVSHAFGIPAMIALSVQR